MHVRGGKLMPMKSAPTPPSVSRGPADHDVRDQIVAAATEHFSRYGYEKTTVSDLAKTIGFSKAYIYKFFRIQAGYRRDDLHELPERDRERCQGGRRWG